MSILETIEKLLLTPVEKFGKDVEMVVVAWVRAEETALVDDAKVAWTALSPVLTKIRPSQWVILQGLVATAQADVADGDYGTLVTDVLNQAAAKELAWVSGLGTAVLTIVLAALHLQKTST